MHEGQLAMWRVVAHEEWGLLVELEGDSAVVGSIAAPYIRDLGENESIEGTQDFPPIGSVLAAMVRIVWPDGALHLSARQSDVQAAESRNEAN